jgi:hypothetical protein
MIRWECIDGILVDYHERPEVQTYKLLRSGMEPTKDNVELSKDKFGHGLYRAKVPGGWLVRPASEKFIEEGGFTFVPDPNHSWNP